MATDHPRSRGVYEIISGDDLESDGSSPLARGLPGSDRHAAGGGRIIPARAGFTFTALIRCLLQSDHPRSRGVYPRPGLHLRDRQGSSPLARGLPHDEDPVAEPAGIIPARAGFTTRPRARR